MTIIKKYILQYRSIEDDNWCGSKKSGNMREKTVVGGGMQGNSFIIK